MVLLLEAPGFSMAVSGHVVALSVIALLSIKVLAGRARSAEPQTAAGSGDASAG